MPVRHEPCQVVRTGLLRELGFYVDPSGHCQVDDYLRALDDRTRERFGRLVNLLVETGRITNTTQFKHEEGEIWGFKVPNQHRVACFLTADCGSAPTLF